MSGLCLEPHKNANSTSNVLTMCLGMIIMNSFCVYFLQISLFFLHRALKHRQGKLKVTRAYPYKLDLKNLILLVYIIKQIIIGCFIHIGKRQVVFSDSYCSFYATCLGHMNLQTYEIWRTWKEVLMEFFNHVFGFCVKEHSHQYLYNKKCIRAFTLGLANAICQ